MVSTLAKAALPGIHLVAADTDWASIRLADAHRKIELRGVSVIGMGTGGNPRWAQRCAEACSDEVRQAIGSPDLVVIVAGMGGGTGVGASPVIAHLAVETGAPVAAVMNLPAGWEEARRNGLAKEGLEALREEIGAVLTLPLARIQEAIDGATPLEKFFDIAQLLLCDCIMFLLGQRDTTEFVGLCIGGVSNDNGKQRCDRQPAGRVF